MSFILMMIVSSTQLPAQEVIEADLLIVGGSESGCAAAVQAARMGVKRIVLVNDIEWLGGQFTSEAVGAIDENRAHEYNGKVPIPRSGLFREIIDAIEAKNRELYGVARPGNTRVITTCRPVVAEQLFQELLAPYVATGQIQRFSNFQVQGVNKLKNRVTGVVFVDTENRTRKLTVNAKITIDASDWGDVIVAAEADYEFGIDAQDKYHEERAPATNHPNTDINPITWCQILIEQDAENVIPMPAGYDAADFQGTWGWIDENFAYTTRRLVDGHALKDRQQPDIILVNNPNVDYPLDVHPADVAEALEATEQGASTKPFVALNPQQREIVYQDAKQRSLKYLYYLQSQFPKFRKMALSKEFGTADHLPPKPYVRESLRLVALHMLKQQEVVGAGDQANYARTMFHDGVFSWQFELDFHPTARKWRSEKGASGPWEANFRGQRRFGAGGTGRAIFPVRSFVPVEIDGLLGAQKNLGYSSIVGSSCRLHDQSMAVGQASGAIAAICLKHRTPPREIWKKANLLAEIWTGLLANENGTPLAIWPFEDVDPYEAEFVAVQQLALRRLLPLTASETSFLPSAEASPEWISSLDKQLKSHGFQCDLSTLPAAASRKELAMLIWEKIKDQPLQEFSRKSPEDADADGIPDLADPLPFQAGTQSWQIEPAPE